MKTRYDPETATLFVESFGKCALHKEMERKPDWNRPSELVEKVVIAEGCERIPMNAFRYYEDLLQVEVPGTVSSIGEAAFQGCSSLRHIDLPNSMKTVGKKAFAMSGLRSIDWPTGLALVESQVFLNCNELKTFNYEGDLHSIHESAFSGCSKLEIKELRVKNSIGWNAFLACVSIRKLRVTSRIVSQWAFRDCIGLKELVLVGCNRLGNACFSYCNLEKVVIYAESDCSKFQSEFQFSNNEGLKSIKVFSDVDVAVEMFPWQSIIPMQIVLGNENGIRLTKYYVELIQDRAKSTNNEYFLLCDGKQINFCDITEDFY